MLARWAPTERGERSTIARFAAAGALALVVLLAGTGLESLNATSVGSSAGHRAVIAARDSKAVLVAATTSRNRGTAWFATLFGAIACAALAVHLVRSVHRSNLRLDLRQLSFRLRAPPRLLVAH